MAEIGMGYQDDIKMVSALNLPWEKLSGCNILITGATGLIGSCLVEVLMSHPKIDYHIFACGRNLKRAKFLFSSYFESPNFTFVQQDVTEPVKCEKDFHYIIHAASGAAPKEFSEHPVEVVRANIMGVLNLMDYGRTHHLKRFLYVSSGEVYGEGDGRVFSEDYSGYVNPMSPRSCYPSSKRAAETLCASYGEEYGIDFVVARPSHTYGPNFTESDNRVYAQFIRNVINGEDIVMKSDGSQYRSFCYVVDCVSALLYILLKGERGQAYNVADGSSNLTIRQLAETIADVANKRVVICIPSDNEKKGYNVVTKSVFDTTKLKTLGWNVDSNFRKKIKSTIESKIKQVQV